MSLRPGLAKAQVAPLLVERRIHLSRVHEGALRAWMSHADVVSEGAQRLDGGTLRWFGSTSILLDPSRASFRAEPVWLARVLAADPHVRIACLRIAEREARVRAPSALGSIRADIDVRWSTRGVLIAVDVMADALDALRDGTRNT
jgi:hypothetical protein